MLVNPHYDIKTAFYISFLLFYLCLFRAIQTLWWLINRNVNKMKRGKERHKRITAEGNTRHPRGLFSGSSHILTGAIYFLQSPHCLISAHYHCSSVFMSLSLLPTLLFTLITSPEWAVEIIGDSRELRFHEAADSQCCWPAIETQRGLTFQIGGKPCLKFLSLCLFYSVLLTFLDS